MERRKTLATINPNERMKFHRRQRRYSSNDLNHGNNFHLSSSNLPNKADDDGNSIKKATNIPENQSLASMIQSEKIPHSHDVLHDDERYQVHLFNDPSTEIHHRHQHQHQQEQSRPPLHSEVQNESSEINEYYLVPSVKRKELPPSRKHSIPDLHTQGDHRSTKLGGNDHISSRKHSIPDLHSQVDHLSSKPSSSQLDHTVQVHVHPHVEIPAVDEAIEESTVLNCKTAIASKPGPHPKDLKVAIPPKKVFLDIHSLSLITNEIAIGSLQNAYDHSSLKEYGITHILNLTSLGENKFSDSIIYLKLPPSTLNDKEDNLDDYFPQAKLFLQHVEEIGGRVLVHCFNGMSRSAAVAIRYLIEQHDLLLLPTYTHVLNCRPVVEMTSNAKLQLAIFEYQHLGCSSVQRHAGPAWNFYEWNRIKSSYGKQNSVHIHTSCGCVIQ